MRINSVVFKMLIPLITVAILVLGITLIVTQTYLKQVIENIFIELQVHHLEKLYSLKMENILATIKQNGIAVADSDDVKKFLASDDAKKGKISEKMKKKLDDLKRFYNLEHIFIVQAESGNYFTEKGFIKVIDTSNKESQWFLRTINSEKRFLINVDSDITGSLHIWLDAVVGDVNKPLGLAGTGMDISSIYEIALEDFKKESADVMIMDNAKVIIGSSNNKKQINSSKIAAMQKEKHNNENLVQYRLKNEDRYLLFIPINELSLTIIVDFSKEKFLNPLRGVYDRIIIGGFILLLFIFIIGIWTFTYFVSRPLKRIASAVSNYDYFSDLGLKGFQNMGYEVDMICDAFNTNTRMLKSTIDNYRQNEELLRSIINAADDLIFYKDMKLRYIGCNSAYEKWSETSVDQIIGLTDSDLYPPDIAESHMKFDQMVMKQKRTIIVEEKFEKPEGTIILEVKKSPFYDQFGNLKGLVVVARDITVVKNMETSLRTLNITLERRVDAKTQELQKSNEILETHIADLNILNYKLIKAKEEAQQAAQARSNFISGISHELRTPLNAIINFTDQVVEDFEEMLVNKELQEDTKGYLKRVMVNSRHLLQLINDLLEFTKAEAGKIDYKIEKNNINTIIKMAFSNTYSLLNGSQVEFFLKLDDDHMEGMVDARRFLQVLLNLLSNAIKFTKHGYVELRSFREDENIIVEVEDTGKGIPQDKYKIIFEPFLQVNSTDSGTGLGLGLAKRMCDDMGIEISFTSVEGEGTIFRLAIKMAS
ncbi:PAS domain-containing protein [bacterium]|nr:PAS domain-containing protein [bacterium]MBU1883061.1 PAS domain-containing protein [bacterium]